MDLLQSAPVILGVIAAILAIVHLLRGGDTLLGVAVLLVAIGLIVAGLA